MPRGRERWHEPIQQQRKKLPIQRGWEGHPGQHRTIALLDALFFFPQMKEDAESYVQTCLVCQQDKIKHKKPGGGLDPLPILTRPSKCYYGFHLLLAQGGWAWKHHGGGYIFKVCHLHVGR